jgi:hypothetical protein
LLFLRKVRREPAKPASAHLVNSGNEIDSATASSAGTTHLRGTGRTDR